MEKSAVRDEHPPRVVQLEGRAEWRQLLAPSNQPLFMMRIGTRTVLLARASSANDRSALIAFSVDGKIRATFTVLEGPGHLAFRIKGMEGAVGAVDLTVRLDLVVAGAYPGKQGLKLSRALQKQEGYMS